ncbi:unnamed protein product [Lepidochelys kempii]
MGPASGPAGSEEPLQEWSVEGNGDLETGGEPDPRRNCRKCNYKKRTVVLPVALATMFLVLIILLAVWRPQLPSAEPGPVAGSDTEGNATISLRPKGTGPAAFLLCYKGRFDHWIGLWRDPRQLSKWANGTKFNNLFQIRGGGDCAYLNDEKGVSSSRCYMGRRWICRKLEVYVMGKETALEGGLKWDS